MPPRIITFVCALVVATTACVPPADEFGENTPMADVQSRGFITIGIPENVRPFAFIEVRTGEPKGFVVDLGTHMARELEVEPRFIAAPSADLPEIVGNGFMDIAFPLTPLTQHLFKVESKLDGFEVTTPYFVAHQRLLVPRGAGVQQLHDLAGKAVCQVLDPIAGVDVATLVGGIRVRGTIEPMECARLLRSGDVEAVTAPDTVLIQIRGALGTDGYHLVGDDLTTEGYPAATAKGMGAWASRVLNEAESASVWSEAYDLWLAPLTGQEPDPPRLTLEDAASIFPMPD